MDKQITNETRNTDAWKQEREWEKLKWRINLLMYKLTEEQMERAYNMVLYVYIYSEDEKKKST